MTRKAELWAEWQELTEAICDEDRFAIFRMYGYIRAAYERAEAEA